MKPTNTTTFISILSAFTMSTQAEPPESQAGNVTDTYHSVTVADPFRWLEDWSDPKVKLWTEAQNVHSRKFLDSRPFLDEIRKDVTAILKAKTIRFYGVSSHGDRFFCMKNEPPKQQPFLITFDSLFRSFRCTGSGRSDSAGSRWRNHD